MSKSTLKDLRQARRDAVRTVDIARRLGRDVLRSELPTMAAALSYRTIFALIPVLALSMIVLGAFATQDQVHDAVTKIIEFTGLGDIVIDAPPATAQPATTQPESTQPATTQPATTQPATTQPESVQPESIQPEAAQPTLVPPESVQPATTQPATTQPATTKPDGAKSRNAQRIDAWIAALVDRMRSARLGAIGVIGVLLLAYVAISMFVEVERAFNKICRAEHGRRWTRRITVYWTLLTLGAFALLASFYVGEKFTGLVANLGVGGLLLSVVGFGVTVAISTSLLLLAYTAVPNARVGFRAASAGAVSAAIMWEAGKWGFTRYLDFSTNYVTFYGSVALLLLFLLWVYVTWLIVLFGLQIAYAFQHFARFRSGEPMRIEGPVLVDPVRFVQVAAVVARAFESARAVDASRVARRCDIPEPLAQSMLERLAGAGVIRQTTADAEADDRFALARPANTIPASELLALGEQAKPPGPALSRLIGARVTAAEGLTLADLLDHDAEFEPDEAQEDPSEPDG